MDDASLVKPLDLYCFRQVTGFKNKIVYKLMRKRPRFPFDLLLHLTVANDFMVLISVFKPSAMKHDVHFVNYGSI